MKERLSVYLDPHVMRSLIDYADRRDKSKSLVAEAAIASFLSPDAAGSVLPRPMTNLSCAGRLFRDCDCCRAVAVSAVAPASAIYAQQQSSLVTRSDVGFRLHAAQLDVTARDQFAVIESSACIEAPDGTLYVVRSRSRAKKELVVGP
jgi:hypothetical protein